MEVLAEVSVNAKFPVSVTRCFLDENSGINLPAIVTLRAQNRLNLEIRSNLLVLPDRWWDICCRRSKPANRQRQSRLGKERKAMWYRHSDTLRAVSYRRICFT